MEDGWYEGVSKVVEQVSMLDCGVWAAEKEAPLGGGPGTWWGWCREL